MKWFNNWIMNRAQQIHKQNESNIQIKMLKEHTLNAINIGQAVGGGGIVRGDRLDAVPDLNFKMFRAENGYVMEVRCHDRKTERQHVNLHVITESEDLGTAISHILTLESLKVN